MVSEMVLRPTFFWIERKKHGCWHTLECSGCKGKVNLRADYRNPFCCPHCGMKMDNGGM